MLIAGKEAYKDAQVGIGLLKKAIYQILEVAGSKGLNNSVIGKSLGIYTGHKRHEGHISRTLLAIMEAEKVVEQLSDKKWRLTDFSNPDTND